MNTTKCPVSRSEFLTVAKGLKVTIETPDGQTATFIATVKEFSSGGLGWNVSEKTTITLDGTVDGKTLHRDAKCQVGLNISVIGSKDLAKEDAKEAA